MLVAGMSSGAVAGAATLYVNDGTDKGCGAFNESSGSQINGAACAIKSMAELDAVGLASGAMVINGYGTFINGRLSMRAGIADADAVNVGQLSPVIEALGGGAKIDAATGEVTGPTYMLNDGDQTSVEGALYSMDGAIATANVSLSHLRSDLNSGSIGLVRQDGAGRDITVASDLAGDAVDFTGKKDGVSQSRRLTGVTDGTLSSTSSDAVTGAQLYATNKNVSSNTDHIAALQSQIGSGAIGLVRQDAVTGAIAVAGSTGGRRVDVAGAEGARVLGGLANGTADSDAVTIAQLKAAGLVDPDGKPMLALVYDDLAMGGATLGGAGGTVLRNLGAGAIAKGSMEAINGGQLFDFQQDVQRRMTALGASVDALNDQVGQIQHVIDHGSHAGTGGSGTGADSVVLGEGALASGSGSTAMGAGARADGNDSTAGGTHAAATGKGSTAMGAGSMASGARSTAHGSGARAAGDESTAIGADAVAKANHSVALGAGSVADRDNTVSAGSAGHERQITHVAAGAQRTDAANWGQVQDAVAGVRDWANRRFERLGRRIDGIGAMSQANAQMAINAGGVQPGGRGRIVAGIGLQGSRSALSVGYANAISEHVRFSVGGSASDSDASVGAGIGIDL
jgi:autotransporter adhesin